MSSSPTGATSTSASSTSSASEAGLDADVRPGRTALVACGAIAQPAADVVTRHGWPVDVHPLPPLLHNQPQRIAGEGAKMALLSVRERAGALALLEEVTYVELSDRPDFNDAFVEQLAFGS